MGEVGWKCGKKLYLIRYQNLWGDSKSAIKRAGAMAKHKGARAAPILPTALNLTIPKTLASVEITKEAALKPVR
jgi:hypothetical protein